VRRRKTKCRFDIAERLRLRLAGQAVHQIQIERLEMLTGQLGGALRFGGTVDAAERLQMFVIETLDAERQAIDAGIAKAGELGGFDRARVGFQRDFSFRREHGERPEGGDQFVDGRRREQAGRAAAEEDTGHRPAPDQRQGGLQIGDQRRDVLGFRNRAIGFMRVEIAIRALLDAPRDVDVERQRRGDAEFERCCGRRRFCGKNGDGTRCSHKLNYRVFMSNYCQSECTRLAVAGS
jgi:hypothetical protein